MRFANRTILLSDDPNQNLVEIDGKQYSLSRFFTSAGVVESFNSCIFLLSDTNQEEDDVVIKISKFYRPLPTEEDEASRAIRRRYGRFITEIEALMRAKDAGLTNVVEVYTNGILKIDGKEFPYYVMEKADSTLKDYVLDNPALDEQDRLSLCSQLLDGLRQLHGIDVYHRDIKPENIFMFGEDTGEGRVVWKIGDLGLIASRLKDYDYLGERIGPFGWISPEVMNKYLTEARGLEFDCKIDNLSDIFQLGNVFWFVYQGNVPLGQVIYDDFVCQVEQQKLTIFEVIRDMIQYSKTRRSIMATLDLIEQRLRPVRVALGI